MRDNTINKKIKETKETLGALEAEKENLEHKGWNEEAEKWVGDYLGHTFENNLVFMDTDEDVKTWVYLVAGIDKDKAPYEILMHQIYISDRGMSVTLDQRTYHSTPYLGHGLKYAGDGSVFKVALREFCSLALQPIKDRAYKDLKNDEIMETAREVQSEMETDNPDESKKN